MTHQAPAAVFGLQMFMRRQHGGNLRFNGLCQELASSGAEYFGQRIGRHPWMVQRDNTIFRHGVSLLAWRPGGFVTPHDTPPPSLSPSPTLGHSSQAVASKCICPVLVAHHLSASVVAVCPVGKWSGAERLSTCPQGAGRSRRSVSRGPPGLGCRWAHRRPGSGRGIGARGRGRGFRLDTRGPGPWP